jgi:hypothetical protein
LARPPRKLQITQEAPTSTFEEAAVAFTRVTEILLRVEARIAAAQDEPRSATDKSSSEAPTE